MINHISVYFRWQVFSNIKCSLSTFFVVLVQEVSKESQELMRKALEEVSCICVTNREFVFAVFFFLSFAGTGISFSLTFTATENG